MNKVLRMVADRFGVTVADMISQRRTRAVLPARHVAAYLAWTVANLSPQEIGAKLGNRDYTNILMYCRGVIRRMEEDMGFRKIVGELECVIRARC